MFGKVEKKVKKLKRSAKKFEKAKKIEKSKKKFKNCGKKLQKVV